MPTHTPYQRHAFLLRYLEARRGRPAPFETLQAAVEANGFMADFGKAYLRRNWERDKRQMEEKFGLDIEMRRGCGYCLPADGPPPDPAALRLADALEMNDFLQLPAALAPFVQPEPRRALGTQHLGPLLRAAQAGRVVEVDYQKHWDDAPRRRTCGPLLLRESRGRWYVLAVMVVGRPHLVCLGLDRIAALESTERPFAPPPDFDAAAYYADCFGITRPTDGQVPEDIMLRFAPVQGRYALSYPLHPSQRLLRDDAAAIELSIRVYDTPELRMELRSYGDAVEVLAPKGLREWWET